MIDLAQLSSPGEQPAPSRMSDGSEIFPYLWRYFLHHEPLRDWLMRAEPFAAAAVSPRQAGQGIAFCCNFSVPPVWKDMAASFDLGEMFIPDHAYSQFMCGTVVAATSYHKHLVCALGPAASRDAPFLPSYQTCVRRMVVDMGSSRSINIIEFSWMQDGALIVTAKILVPPDPSFPYQSAGCTGAFAFFKDVMPAGPTPTILRSLVSFVEVPRCPFCTARGSLGCYCSGELAARASREGEDYSSAVWPPRLPHDVQGPTIDTYHNIRSRLDLIQHIAHVKITAHVVTSQDVVRESGPPAKTYKLGPSRFVVRAVLFRPANSFEADTLRQVADKLRLLRAGSLRVTAALQEQEHAANATSGQLTGYDIGDSEQWSSPGKLSGDAISCPSASNIGSDRVYRSNFATVLSSQSSCVSGACRACANPWQNHGRQAHTCSAAASTGISEGTKSRTGSVHISNITDAPSDGTFPWKRLRCPRCDKTFSQQGSLNRHLKNIHEENKIPCQFCNMSFGQMFDLKVSRTSPQREFTVAVAFVLLLHMRGSCERFRTRDAQRAVVNQLTYFIFLVIHARSWGSCPFLFCISNSTATSAQETRREIFP